MSPHRLLHSASLRTRRVLTGAAIVAYLLSVWGFPVPQTTQLDTSIAFPCQHHRCGCNSAAECWQSCCCFTPHERIVWARENQVTIPDDALAAMHDEEQHRDAVHYCGGDCDHDHGDHDHGDHDHADRDAEIATHANSADGACAACGSRETKAAVTWVLAFQARKCRGLSTQWVTSGAALPLEILTLWEFDWASAGRIVSLASEPCSLVSSPPVPPPRA